MRGKITSISNDILGKGFVITLNVKDTSVQELQTISQFDDLDIKLAKHREKRSIDANNYLWILCTKIAEVVHSSKDEIYEEMLQKYGSFAEDENGYVVVTVKDYVDMSKIDGHWKFVKAQNGFKSYMMIQGSSQYNTLQMSHLIDGVVSEARELGIETITTTELKQMKERWGV